MNNNVIFLLIICLTLLRRIETDSDTESRNDEKEKPHQVLPEKPHQVLPEKPHQVHGLYDEFMQRLRPLNFVIQKENIPTKDTRSAMGSTSLYDIFKKRLSCITNPYDHQYADITNDELETNFMGDDGKRCDHCYGEYLKNKSSADDNRIDWNLTEINEY
ncbi:uncharacterized protein LOC109612075 [Musca domestica]|uniref:Uncharacterized protein LOC109612075 n=1 Tax=Musca domestica TaxID=7370 RepID=A0A9J7DG72_MUSDO|nr:uncharacterized protein LOC109612075 [Musca domestica]